MDMLCKTFSFFKPLLSCCSFFFGDHICIHYLKLPILCMVCNFDSLKEIRKINLDKAIHCDSQSSFI